MNNDIPKPHTELRAPQDFQQSQFDAAVEVKQWTLTADSFNLQSDDCELPHFGNQTSTPPN